MSRQTYRKGIDPGIGSVRHWIDKWYGDSTEIKIELLKIPVPGVAQGGAIHKSPQYIAAFRGNETPLHGMLKFAAYEWLRSQCNEIPLYEQTIYTPIEELTSRVRCINCTFDPTIPQLIEKGRIDVQAENGIIIVADLYCERCTLEVGYTQPFNLFTPMLDDLVDASIWLPFPKGITAKNFDPLVDLLGIVNAYKFSFC